MLRLSVTALLLLPVFTLASDEVKFDVTGKKVKVFETVEFTATVKDNSAKNPFADCGLSLIVTDEKGNRTRVPGFCASADGSLYRVRYMPSKPGTYQLAPAFAKADGTFTGTATSGLPDGKADSLTLTVEDDKKARGPVQIDKDYPHHFVYAGTGDHYFWNGTTTYWLLGVQDDKKIEEAIDRLAKLKVNRIRVALNARTKDGGRWFEPQVKESKDFKFQIDPWPAKNKDDREDPRFDTARFNLALWDKLDKLVAHAREKGVVVSVVFHLDGPDKGVDPFNGGKKGGEGYKDYAAEEAYYRYAIARLGGFSNVMWDVTNEWHQFRDEKWVNHFGDLIRKVDTGGHLISVHGRGDFPFYKSAWADFAMYQSWDDGGAYKFLLKGRELADKAVRPMPQINEEYGYEDHYPGPWGGGKKKPARSADTRRTLAWQMCMAGGYQTTGERADEPGQGGWITGLGNDKMTMLDGYARMADFFTSFDWWKLDPAEGIADNGGLVLAEKNKRYAVYAPTGGRVNLKLPSGDWRVRLYNPRTGEWGKKFDEKADDGGLTLKFAEDGDWAAVPEVKSPPPLRPVRTAPSWQLRTGRPPPGTRPLPPPARRTPSTPARVPRRTCLARTPPSGRCRCRARRRWSGRSRGR